MADENREFIELPFGNNRLSIVEVGYFARCM
jgi:hypothetical protein